MVNLKVLVTDGGDPALSNTEETSVDINLVGTADEMPPVWDDHNSTPLDDLVLDLDENTAPGTVVANFKATTSQGGESITYNLITRPGVQSPFRIHILGGDEGINLVVQGFPQLVYTEENEHIVKIRASVSQVPLSSNHDR